MNTNKKSLKKQEKKANKVARTYESQETESNRKKARRKNYD